MLAAKYPAEQLVHWERPEVDEKVPSEQLEHTDADALENEPALQIVHTDAPVKA